MGGSSLFPEDLRSTSAPPTQQNMSARRVETDGQEQFKYFQENQSQPWPLWQNNEEGT